MASATTNPILKDGGSNNKPPLFFGEYFDFWKIRMKAHLEAQGEEVWDAVENDLFVPTSVVNGVGQQRLKLNGMKMIRKKSFTTRKQSTYFKVHLAWTNSFVSLNVQ